MHKSHCKAWVHRRYLNPTWTALEATLSNSILDIRYRSQHQYWKRFPQGQPLQCPLLHTLQPTDFASRLSTGFLSLVPIYPHAYWKATKILPCGIEPHKPV